MPKKENLIILALPRHEVVTAHFALVNYIKLLKKDLEPGPVDPANPHKRAEAVMALSDAEPLLEKVDKWLQENPR